MVLDAHGGEVFHVSGAAEDGAGGDPEHAFDLADLVDGGNAEAFPRGHVGLQEVECLGDLNLGDAFLEPHSADGLADCRRLRVVGDRSHLLPLKL